jgi:cell division septum initiation protein DivIVA
MLKQPEEISEKALQRVDNSGWDQQETLNLVHQVISSIKQAVHTKSEQNKDWKEIADALGGTHTAEVRISYNTRVWFSLTILLI